jgi:hypothetical protein
VYSAIPSTLPGNVVSLGFEATSTSEFGDEVGLTQTGYLSTANVVMSSWGCQSGGWSTQDCSTTPGATFTHPITFNVYSVNDGSTPTVGSLLMSKTQTFTLPYRPSADNTHCTGDNAGEWFSSADNTCYNGKAAPIQFDMSNAIGAGTLLPSHVIWTVAFNTSDYGATPLRPQPCNTNNNCPYDSLNVGANGSANTGTDVDPDGAFFSSTWAGAYCDNGAAGTGTLRYDTGVGVGTQNCNIGHDWTGYTPMASLQLFGPPVISIGSLNIPEGNAGYHFVTVPVTLDHPSTHTITVQYRTQSQTAVAGSDFVGENGTLTFSPGHTTPDVPLTVDINGDQVVEPYEHFGVYLTNPSNASLLGSPRVLKATVTLQNDDLPTMRATTATVTEGQGGTVTFKTSQVYNQPIVINLSLQDGTAVAPGDYGPLPVSSITIPVGAKSASVTIPTIIDGVVERGETFYVHGTGVLTATGKVIIQANST